MTNYRICIVVLAQTGPTMMNCHHAILSLFTDNSPSEEPPASSEGEEREESDHEGAQNT